MTEEQKLKRIKANKVIFKVFGILFLLFAGIFVFAMVLSPSAKETAAYMKLHATNMDSVVALVKKNKDFEIKDVYYNPKDSSFKIAFTDRDNTVTEGTYSTTYFDSTYHLDKLPEVEGTYLYAYNHKKSLKGGDYKEALTYESRTLAVLKTRFDDKFLSHALHTYQPLYDYMKSSLNDPSSLEFAGVENLGMNEDSTFSIQGKFRAKNGFGGIMLHSVRCNISMDGRVTKVKVDQ